MIDQLREEMQRAGFHPPEIVLNNDFYRFKIDPKDHKDSAWLIGHTIDGTDLVVATFGSWQTGEQHVFSPTVPKEYKARFAQEQKRLIDEIEKKKIEQADRAAIEAKERMRECATANFLTNYLKRKNIRELFGARPSADAQMGAHLAIPMTNVKGEIRGVQRIRNDGERKYLYGTNKRGLMHVLRGDLKSASVIYIAEGFATTATLAQSLSDGAFVCAFDAGNLEWVAREIFSINKDAHIVICADNDEMGLKSAEKAALAVNGLVNACPVAGKDFNDIGEAQTSEAFNGFFKTDVVIKQDAEIILPHFTGKDSLDSLQMQVACAGKVLFDSAHQEWYSFDGVWRRVPEDNVHKSFMRTMDRGFPEGYKTNQYDSFFRMTRRRLSRSLEWNIHKNLLPFANGVLNTDTLELLPHSPEFYFNWSVPYVYNPKAKCPTIDQFLKDLSCEKSENEEILVAFLAAIMRGRADLQRYLELIGLPGTGKSSYIKLAQSLIGMRENTITTSMGALDNRFETAGFFGKKLVVITDAEQYSKSVEVFKSLTGQDPIRFERKSKDSGPPFIYDGMVLVAANNPIQFDDKSTAIARRRVTVNIDKPLKRIDSKIHEKIDAELPGIVNRILAMPNEWIDSILSSATHADSASRIRALIETNPVAQWLDENCTLSADAKTKVGSKVRRLNGQFENADTQLFPNYLKWASESNRRELSAFTFSHALREIISMQNWPVTREKYLNLGWHYFGIRILRTGEECPSIFVRTAN